MVIDLITITLVVLMLLQVAHLCAAVVKIRKDIAYILKVLLDHRTAIDKAVNDARKGT